ncbi:MAG: hypothetical protein M3R06_04180 [Chloroflexota bacterium]|nr:hypothetical protein [Chloroflexota bacterium]
MGEQAIRDHQEAVADGTADAVWVEDEERLPMRVTISTLSEWMNELTWLADAKHHPECDVRPEEERAPEGVEEMDIDEAYGVELDQADLDRLVELTGVPIGS